MVGRTTLVAAIGLVAMLILAVPHRASACGCCACDLTNVPGFGDVECGVGDSDCVECLNIGGVPAMNCSVCASPTGACVNNTFCVDHEMGMCGLPPKAGAPALTPWGLLAMALLLGSAGVFTLRRRMRGR
jgi:LPXTG-motif cell wall-anchored protein